MSNDDWDKLTKELNELCKRYGCDFRFANGISQWDAIWRLGKLIVEIAGDQYPNG